MRAACSTSGSSRSPGATSAREAMATSGSPSSPTSRPAARRYPSGRSTCFELERVSRDRTFWRHRERGFPVMRKLLVAAFAVLLLQAPALAADDLDKVSWGAHWFGP